MGNILRWESSFPRRLRTFYFARWDTYSSYFPECIISLLVVTKSLCCGLFKKNSKHSLYNVCPVLHYVSILFKFVYRSYTPTYYFVPFIFYSILGVIHDVKFCFEWIDVLCCHQMALVSSSMRGSCYLRRWSTRRTYSTLRTHCPPSLHRLASFPSVLSSISYTRTR